MQNAARRAAVCGLLESAAETLRLHSCRCLWRYSAFVDPISEKKPQICRMRFKIAADEPFARARQTSQGRRRRSVGLLVPATSRVEAEFVAGAAPAILIAPVALRLVVLECPRRNVVEARSPYSLKVPNSFAYFPRRLPDMRWNSLRKSLRRAFLCAFHRIAQVGCFGDAVLVSVSVIGHSLHFLRPPQWGLNGEGTTDGAARESHRIRRDPERNKICRRQFCLRYGWKTGLTQDKQHRTAVRCARI